MKSAILLSVLAAAIVCVSAWSAEAAPPRPSNHAEIVKGNNAFAWELYAKLAEKEGNVFLSPYSISTALGMTYAGARGQTAEQVAKVMHFPIDQEKMHPAFAALMRELQSAQGKRSHRLHIANAIYTQKGQDLLPDFLRIVQKEYQGGLDALDFRNSPEQARQVINAWVEKQTEDKIRDLIQPGVLTPATQLVLTNAIYFHGEWMTKFPKSATKDDVFHVAGREQANVPTMNVTGEFSLFEDDQLQALQMPYHGNRVAMLVLLPRKTDGLRDLEKGMTEAKMAELLGKMEPARARVALPKWKMTREADLAKTMSEMGMPLLFGGGDLSGIRATKDLGVSNILHKAFIDVMEDGTEAAAATSVIVARTGIPQKPKEFKADHPFLFVIRDIQSGTTLFLGRVTDPRP